MPAPIFVTDEEIFRELRVLAKMLGRVPSADEVLTTRPWQLTAAGLIQRFGSLDRALLLAGVWFPQPSRPDHEPLELSALSVSPQVRALFDDSHTQILQLNGFATPEDVVLDGVRLGFPVGGMFSTDIASSTFVVYMNPTSARLLAVTASARAYEVLGTLVTDRNKPYLGTDKGDLVKVAMVVTYDLTEYDWHHDGRFAMPGSVDLGEYTKVQHGPVRA